MSRTQSGMMPSAQDDKHDGADEDGRADKDGRADEALSRPYPHLYQKVKSLPRRAALTLLWVYQMGISPLKPGPTCRFEPVCSAYAIDAVKEYGALRGSMMAAIRLTKCGPWHPGGWDPVKPRRISQEDCVEKSSN